MEIFPIRGMCRYAQAKASGPTIDWKSHKVAEHCHVAPGRWPIGDAWGE